MTEPKVANVVQAVLIGGDISQVSSEDRQYVLDLGILKLSPAGGLEVANPIYKEVIPRELNSGIQQDLREDPLWYVSLEGRLDIEKVITNFISFYKENSEMLTARKQYSEAAHHLLFMAWLQRVVNGGGKITREYALGLKRLDVCIDFAQEKFAFELKLYKENVVEEGTQQLSEYLDRLDLDGGWLVIFRRNPPKNWNRVGEREMIKGDKKIEVIWL